MIVPKEEWGKLHIAKFNDWTLGVCPDQHVLGWLTIYPPRKIQGSLTSLSDQELIEFKQIAIIAEELLKEAFNAEWFNYWQAGNVVKNLHIHLQPRYSSPRTFNNLIFTDKGFGGPLKMIPQEELATKEIVFQIVKELQNLLNAKDIKEVEVLNH